MRDNVVNLRTEMAKAVQSMTARHFRAVLDAGVPPDTAVGADPFAPAVGLVRARTSGDGRFIPHDSGRELIVTPAGWLREDGYGWSSIFDLVAFDIAGPDRWWTRLGLVEMLGEQLLHEGRETLHGVKLAQTPLDYLRSGCTRACVLDWRFDPQFWLLGAPIISAPKAIITRLRKRAIAATLECFNFSAEGRGGP